MASSLATRNEVGTDAHYALSVAEKQERGPAVPGELLRLPGWLGKLIAWSDRPPLLALAEGLTLLSALTGRKVQDANGTRTNLFCIGLGPASNEAIKSIIDRAGGRHLLSGLPKRAGLTSALAQQPALLLLFDQAERLLNPEMPQASLLSTLFSSAGSTYQGIAYADSRRTHAIDQPHVCLYGTATAADFRSKLADVLGYPILPRLLLVFDAGPVAIRKPAPYRPPPADVIDTARLWLEFDPGQAATLEATPAADAILEAYSVHFEAMQADGPAGTLWTRTHEHARKLAMLRACSDADVWQCDWPTIEFEHARWACDLAEHLTRRLAWLATKGKDHDKRS